MIDNIDFQIVVEANLICNYYTINYKLENNLKAKLKPHMNEELEDYFINKRFFKSNTYIASDNLKKFSLRNMNSQL